MFRTFIEESGLTALAVAHLSQQEYAVILYLLNCSASGFHELITTEKEIAGSIGSSLKDLKDAIDNLGYKNMIITKYTEGAANDLTKYTSLRIGLQYDIKKWNLDIDENQRSRGAIIFPFMKNKAFQLYSSNRDVPSLNLDSTVDKPLPTWQRVLLSYMDGRDFENDKVLKAQEEAKILVEHYPVDQILLFLRHFRHRIPTLSLLASSWSHYEELFEAETQKVDILDAKQKHSEQDGQVRENAIKMLEESDDAEFSEDEVAVLETLANHNHPRRQLFWAYQTRGRYPKLRNFFRENKRFMLPITTRGLIIKRKPHQDS